MSKILFLDFDGPLTNQRTFMAFDKPQGRDMWTTADPVAIAMLNHLYDVHKFKIVITSDWRLTNLTPTKMSARRSLEHWGYKGEFHEDFMTPRLKSGYNAKYIPSRSDEIQSWLQANQDEVETFASLDDLPLKIWTNNIRVDGMNGASHKDYDQLHNFLSGGGYSIQMLKDRGLLF